MLKATETKPPDIPLRFEVAGATNSTSDQDITGIDVGSVPHVVYFLEDEETLAKVPSM